MNHEETTSSRALVIGRFQPYHRGHHEIFKKVQEDGYGEVVVAVGSAEKAHHYEDPFTCGERIEMIDAALRDKRFDHYFIVGVPDINDDSLWVSHVGRYVPRCDALYAGNQRTIFLYEMENKKLGREAYKIIEIARTVLTNYRKNPPEPIETSGTLIRKLMAEGDETWKDLLPEPVVRKVIEFDGPERLGRLSKMD